VVNRAGRLLAVGHGGQVLVTGAAYELLADRLRDGVGFRDLGEHCLMDLGRAERVFEVTGPGLAEGFGPLRSLNYRLRAGQPGSGATRLRAMNGPFGPPPASLMGPPGPCR
jgi:hypothetical protein